MTVSIRIVGLDRVLDKMDRRALLDKPMRKFFTRVSTDIVARARRGAPVDRGQLRNSIDYDIESNHPPMRAEVGVLNAPHPSGLFWKAAAMEYGTGLLAEGPNASGRRHYPPAAALELWAVRHGVNPITIAGRGTLTPGETVAYYIGRRGGLRPRRYLRNAMNEVVRGRLRTYCNQLEDDIRREWDT